MKESDIRKVVYEAVRNTILVFIGVGGLLFFLYLLLSIMYASIYNDGYRDAESKYNTQIYKLENKILRFELNIDYMCSKQFKDGSRDYYNCLNSYGMEKKHD